MSPSSFSLPYLTSIIWIMDDLLKVNNVAIIIDKSNNQINIYKLKLGFCRSIKLLIKLLKIKQKGKKKKKHKYFK